MAADVGGAIKTGPSPWQPIYNEFKMQHGTKKKKVQTQIHQNVLSKLNKM